MKFLIIIWLSLGLISSIKSTSSTFCPTGNGTFVNPDDYRSYYVCKDFYPQLNYCSSPVAYYSRIEQKCKPEPTDWRPTFDLTGSYQTTIYPSIVFIRQDGYNVFFTRDTSTEDVTFIGRYINTTHIIGMETMVQKINNCVINYNVQMRVTNNKSYCVQNNLHPFSSKCGLNILNSFNGCYTY